MAIRLYEFRVNGFIGGIPGEFPGGTQVLIDDVTNQVISWGPLGQPLTLPEPPQEAEQQPEQAPQQPEQAPASDPLADALQKLGG